MRRPILIALALAILALPATVPFWQPNFIFTADSPLHLWRVYELDRALASGTFYPRWAPDLYFGYGYPVFNFYPPLSYYAVELFHLIGLDLVNAFKVVFSLCILLAATGAFLLAHDFYEGNPVLNKPWQVDLASLLTAAAYAYTPYLLIDVFIRGASAETLGMAILPFYIWSLRRVLARSGLANVLLCGIVGAIFLLSHNLTALFSAPVLLGYILLRVLFLSSARARLFALARVGLSEAVTVLLSAFYLLPEVLELPWVYIGQPKLSQAELLRTILDHIQPVGHVVQLSWLYQYPEASFPLGLASVALAAGGFVLGLAWLKRQERAELGYWLLIALLVIFALVEWSRPLWLALPALWIIQFVWRLTLFSTVGLSLAVGAWVVAAARLMRRDLVIAAVAVIVVANIVATSVLGLRGKTWAASVPAVSNPEVLARYEVDYTTGMSSMNEFLPVWAYRVPLPNLSPGRPVVEQTAAAAPPAIDLATFSSNEIRLAVNAPQSVPLSFRTFYYPDWQAWIDGQPSPVRPSTNVGLLTVDVPAGAHQVRLAHGSLPARDLGWALTAIGLIGVGIGVVYLIRSHKATWKPVVIFASTALLAFVGPQLRAVGASSPALHPLQVDLDPELRLVGYSTEETPGGALKLRVYWQVKQLITREQAFRIQLADDSGRVWAARTQLPRYGTAGMQYWVPNELAEDEYDLFLPHELPGAPLTLSITREGGDSVPVARVSLTVAMPQAADPIIDHKLDGTFGDSISLVGYNATGLAQARPGNKLDVTLFWRATRDVQEDLTVFFQLLDSNGRLVAQNDSLPNNGFTPTMLWPPGATIADRRDILLPDSMAAGVYHLVAGLYRFHTMERLPVSTTVGPAQDDLVELGAIKVHPLAQGPPEHRLDLRIGQAIRAQGFTLAIKDKSGSTLARADGDTPTRLTTPAKGQLQLTMAWLAEGPVGADYTVFVHLLDANGKIARQQDNPPVNGTYPTSIWDAGETVSDPYSLALSGLPPGDYRLVAGMYRPDTGERLPVVGVEGGDLLDREVELAKIEIAK